MEQKPLVLIVDDNPGNIQVLGNILKNEGLDTAVAMDGTEAIKFVRNEIPSLILLDIMMPDLDGYEVCRILKLGDVTREIPVIFITALNGVEDKVKAFNLGAVDYITKPFQHKEVVARVNTHLRLMKQKAELLELNKLKDRFFSIISHDLRGPLVTLAGMNEVLLEELDKFPHSLKETVAFHARATERLISLTENLLTWTDLRGNKVYFHPSEINLKKIVRRCLDTLEAQLRNKEITVDVDVSGGLVCWGDPNMIETVIRNIVTNGIKFSHRKGTIYITGKMAAPFVELVIRDEGVGISPENKKKLFIQGEKVETRGTEGEAGSGLGLLICRDFMEKNKGKVSLTSVQGEGTSFHLYLLQEFDKE